MSVHTEDEENGEVMNLNGDRDLVLFLQIKTRAEHRLEKLRVLSGGC